MKGFELVLVGAIAALLLLCGCTGSSKYVACCQRNSIFDTSTSPNTLLGHPSCIESDGTPYGKCLGNASGLTADNFSGGVANCAPDASLCTEQTNITCSKIPGCIVKNNACMAEKCQDITDASECASALCSWNSGDSPPCSDRSNSFAGFGSSDALIAMPICTDESPASCTNNRCTAMLCGYTALKAAPPPSSQDWDAGINSTNQNYMLSKSSPPAINLLDTSCTFKPMSQKTYNEVQNSRGSLWVNAFRFGVGQSFSDFEQSRYLLPVSDKFCSASPTPYTKDRYVTYYNAKSTWCSDISGYYQCSENGLNFSDYNTCTLYCKSDSNCALQPGTKSWCRQSNFTYNDQATCKQECDIVQNPGICPISQDAFPFLNANGGFALDAYGDIDASFYSSQLKSQYRPVGGASYDNLLDFECESDSECTSGYCTSDGSNPPYVRGRCLNASNGQRIDCGCYEEQSPDGGMFLNCSDANAAGYPIYASTDNPSGDRVTGRAQGGWDSSLPNPDGTFGGFNPWFESGSGYYCDLIANNGHSCSSSDTHCNLNPYCSPSGGGETTNQYVDTKNALFYDTAHTDVGGDDGGGNKHSVFRYYIDAGKVSGVSQPPSGPDNKFFKNCEIPRTNKTYLYQPYINGAPYGGGSGWNGGGPPAALDLSNAPDGLGPKAQKMCVYTFRKDTRVWDSKFWGTSHSDMQYINGITPPLRDSDDSKTACPGLGTEPSWWQFFWGTYYKNDEDRFYTIYTNNGGTSWPNNQGELHWMWVYDIDINDSTAQIGNCNLSSTGVAPYFNVKNVGWCEGCTYSTLASQKIPYDSGNDWMANHQSQAAGEVEDQIASNAPLYLQANIMPVFDAQDSETNYYAYYQGYQQGGAYDYYEPDLLSEETDYNPEWICSDANGAAIYVVGNTTMLADSAQASSTSNYGTFYPRDGVAASDSALFAYPGGQATTTGYLADDTDCSDYEHEPPGYTGCYLDSRAAVIWRAMTLKTACTNAPLAAISIDGFANSQQTGNPAVLQTLIGNATNPGTLFSFFYKEPPADNEFGRRNRIMQGTPDSYPGKIDLLMQQWYPTCELGTEGEFEARLNFSRALLSNFSRSSLVWKFHFPQGSLCNQPEFLQYLFSHKGELVDAGIVGLIYDDWSSGDGRLDTGLPNGRSNTPFCAVQNYSRGVLGISTHTYGQKVYATDQGCLCEPCTPASYSLGICDPGLKGTGPKPAQENIDQLYCADGTQCQFPSGYAGDYWDYYCPQACANYTACTPCSDAVYATTSAFCRVQDQQDVWKTNKPYSSLSDSYWDIISALPAQDKCCLETQSDDATLRYTYLKRSGATQNSEFLQFPGRGETGLDCGRTPETSALSYCNIQIPTAQEDITCWQVKS